MVKIQIRYQAKKIYFCFWALFCLGFGCLFKLTTVYAETVASVFSEAVPQGLAIEPWFTLGQIPNNMTTFRTLSNGTTALVMTQEIPGGFGAVWSKESSGNVFDLSKRQTLDMWLYFGKRRSGAGDGLAFVLQNDPKQDQAFAKTATGALAGGETLGTFGLPNINDTPEMIASRGIQNSWALTFDTYLNPSDSQQNKIGDQFDRHLNLTSASPFQHLMSNYPGAATSYNSDGSLNHNDLALLKDHFADSRQQYFSNGTWHHLQLSWDPETQAMTYTFDDANFGDDIQPDGSPSGNGFTKTVPIDTKQFHLAPGQHTVKWGFTGTTTQGVANNIAIFETIPAITMQDSRVEIWDTTQNRLVTENGSVVSSDELRVRYNLHYLSGTQAWQNIVGQLVLPNSMAYTSAKLTYPGTDLPAERINLNNMNDFQMKQKISQALNPKTTTAQLDFIGNAAGTNVTITPETSRFIGTQAIATLTTPNFYIRSPRPLTIKATETALQVRRQTPAILKGTLAYQDYSRVDNQRVTLFAKVNEATTTLQALVSDGSNVSGQYRLTIPATLLRPGPNQVSVYALDHDGNRTGTVHYTVEVIGFMYLQVAPTMNFEQGTISPIGQLLKRQAGWQIRLTDTLPVGQRWVLQARATPLYQNEMRLRGDIIYRDETGGQQVVTDQLVNVASGIKQTAGTTTTEITDQWRPDTGLLLLTEGPNQLGFYTGTLTWQVIQSLP